MPAKKKDTLEEEGNGVLDSISRLDAILKRSKGDHLNYTEKVEWKSSTGSLLLDAATGMVSPGLWRLTGNNNSGKTPQTLEIVRNMFETLPKVKCIWVIAEGRGLSEENVKRTGMTFTENVKEWENKTIFVLNSNIFELFIDTIKDLVYNNPEGYVYAFVVDSVDGLILRDDAAKPIDGNNKVAGVPALAKKMMQSLSLGMFRFGHWLGLISQVTAEIKLDTYAPKGPDRGGNFSGGNSLLHASNIILNYDSSRVTDFIMEPPGARFNDPKAKVLGQEVRVTVGKAILEKAKKQTITYPIKHGRKPSGIWREREIGDLLIALGLVIKPDRGAWMDLEENFKNEIAAVDSTFPLRFQGLNKLYEAISSCPVALKYLDTKIRDILEHGE